jgi:hypothetical protein
MTTLAKQDSVNSQQAARKFKRDAADHAKTATASKQVARQVLVDLGVYTRSGKLSKNYSK